MAKTDAVLDVLPSVYGATDGHKLVSAVVRALATPLEAADSELFRIQRAHRLAVAEHPRDIVLLAGALDLDGFHFKDLLEAPLDHEARLGMMRERVRRIAALHLDGLGTPWAIIEAAAAFLEAEVVPDAVGGPLVRHLDEEGYSHVATIAFPHSPGGDRESIVLHENPSRRTKVEPAPRWPGDGWTADCHSVEVGPVRLAIRGVGDRTVLPTVFCPDLPGGVVFNGLVPDGVTLLVDPDGRATLGDRDVTPWMVVYRGGMHDYVDADGSTYSVESGEDIDAFTGDPEEEHAWEPAHPLPRPTLGQTTWRYSVTGGIYDGRRFDQAVFEPAEAPVGRFDEDPAFEQCVYDVPPSGVVGMAWDERTSCAFKLLVPHRVPPLGSADQAPGPDSEEIVTTSGNDPNYSARIAEILPRFRSAGVTAYVDKELDGWVLGRGVLRDSGATGGEGVEFHSIRLVDRDAESLVPFDPAERDPSQPQRSDANGG